MQRQLRGIYIGYKPQELSSSILSSRSISHWFLLVGDGHSEHPYLSSELFAEFKGKKIQGVYHNTAPQYGRSRPSYVTEAFSRSPVGNTDLTDQEIAAEADRLISQHGRFDLISNSCQDFVNRMVVAIKVGPRPAEPLGPQSVLNWNDIDMVEVPRAYSGDYLTRDPHFRTQ